MPGLNRSYGAVASVLLMVVASCSSPTEGSLQLPPPIVTSSTTTVPVIIDVPTLEPCPLPDVQVGLPPATVSETASVATTYNDDYTFIPGTSQQVFANDDGMPAMVVVRGALPPVDWSGITEAVEVRSQDGLLGPLPDGVWAIAWADSPDRCDLYSIYIYPPGTVEDARRVAGSIR